MVPDAQSVQALRMKWLCRKHLNILLLNTLARKQNHFFFFKWEKEEVMFAFNVGWLSQKIVKNVHSNGFFSVKDISTKAFLSSSKWCNWCSCMRCWTMRRLWRQIWLLHSKPVCCSTPASCTSFRHNTKSPLLGGVTVRGAPGGDTAFWHTTSSFHWHSPPQQGTGREYCLAESQVELQCLKCT